MATTACRAEAHSPSDVCVTRRSPRNCTTVYGGACRRKGAIVLLCRAGGGMLHPVYCTLQVECCKRCFSSRRRRAGGDGSEGYLRTHTPTVLQRRAVRLTVDTARSDSYAPALQECHVRVCTRTRPAAGRAPRAARHGSAGLRARALVRAWVRGRGPEAMTLTQSVRVRHDQRILSHLSGAVPHARASLALPRTWGRRCSAVHADQ